MFELMPNVCDNLHPWIVILVIRTVIIVSETVAIVSLTMKRAGDKKKANLSNFDKNAKAFSLTVRTNT
jgi:hypothetical protein